jgi:hypothetical protein
LADDTLKIVLQLDFLLQVSSFSLQLVFQLLNFRVGIELVDLCEFAGRNIAVAGAKTPQAALIVCHRLAAVFNPADLSVPSLNTKLNLVCFWLLSRITIMLVPYITILRCDNLSEK